MRERLLFEEKKVIADFMPIPENTEVKLY